VAALVVTGDLDYSDGATQVAEVVVTDSDAGNSSTNFKVAVVNVNDAPTSTRLLHSSLREDAKQGVLVTDLVTVDRDAHDTFTYTILNKEPTPFVIAGSELVVKQPAKLDHETSPVVKLIVKTTDSGKPARSIIDTFDIRVLDANEPPTDIFLDLMPFYETLRVRVASRSISPRWRSIRFRPLICTYDAPPCGPSVRADERAKSRKIPTRNALPLFFVIRWGRPCVLCCVWWTGTTPRSCGSGTRARWGARTRAPSPSTLARSSRSSLAR